ncbi:uncharacterized protein LOC131245727 [Magnolia sinica]|uniref:uncharacterized protein LOC131245727 n=1 Tax=Magnolia sinica TaxID=86752 RepID=UPI0026599DEB|nr:uncharacterized protein LOC131245727 [Magnolia sinica]
MQSVGPTTTAVPRRVMVVADPRPESEGALEWALSHALLARDELILLHVEPNSSRRHSFATFLKRPPTVPGQADPSSVEGGDYEFLDDMRTTCLALQPRVQVQVERVDMDGRDKASVILLQAKVFSVDLIVIGQRRHFSQIFLGGKLGGKSANKAPDTAEYLIENSKCLCVGVQKKGQKAGYVLNTKTRRNFWLLA